MPSCEFNAKLLRTPNAALKQCLNALYVSSFIASAIYWLAGTSSHFTHPASSAQETELVPAVLIGVSTQTGEISGGDMLNIKKDVGFSEPVDTCRLSRGFVDFRGPFLWG
jgi:hypothetical protein